MLESTPRWILVLSILVPLACAPGSDSQVLPEPPVAQVIPTELEKHGHIRVDDYFWLRERENPEVLELLRAENRYTDAMLAHTADLQDELYEEIIARIKEDDTSVPYEEDGYQYYRRFEKGSDYAIYCRRKADPEADEEVMLDANKLAEGHEYFNVRGFQVSSDRNILSYSTDTVGRRFYTRRFRDLVTGKDLPDMIPDVTANSAWANDNKTLFYTRQHPDTLRWHRIYKHILGTDSSQDELVYEEDDEEFEVYVFKTKSRRFIMMAIEQSLSSEYRILDANKPEEGFDVFLPREDNHEYSLQHFDNKFYIRTNWQAKNFRLMAAPLDAKGKKAWTEVIPHREEVYLSSFEIFRRQLVVSERKGGLIQMRMIPWNGDTEHYLDFGEPAYDASFGDNREFDTNILRYEYSSLTTPESVYDYDMNTRVKTLMKREDVLGDFDATDYASERLHAPATDGTLVPISIVYRKGLKKNGQKPLLLYGYGSYGYSLDASFRSSRLSLLDRGFAFAIAHIRGGQELGRDWYEDGKLMKKKNTFTDFIDCARYLVTEGYTDPEHLYAHGGSAGGLLMGAVTNMAPDLFHGIVSEVAFVDVVTTMLDADIPLTTSEYDEWGNPNEKEAYEYMLSYSPYDNIEAKDYPNLLLTTGLHDSQVQYWEPAKYVAKMRKLKTDDNLLLLRTNMEAGHGGASGRFKRHKETALVYAFLLDLEGIEH